MRQVLTSFAGAGTGGADVLDLFGSIGLDLAESVVTEDESAAVDAAVRIGYPVVLKAADSAILHKTELGGVFLGLESNDEVRTAFRALRELGVKSVLVQRQVTGGTELIVGLQTDPALGTFLLVGLGGVWTEVLEDVSIRPVGLREGEVTDMLQELRGSRLLHGERGAAPVDLRSLVEAIERVDAFGVQFGATVMSMDINPLIVTSTGSYAVDGLIMLRS